MSCNEYEGFRLSRTARGVELEFIMPRELSGKFFARIYARGPLNDEALGDPARVWAALSPEYGGRPLVAPHQVHGVNIIEAAEGEALPVRSEADGIFIGAGCRALASLRFADCTPVVIAAAGDKPWMTILHSGFKGTLLNISAAALKRYGNGSAKGKIWAWIGPRIGACCYSRRADDPATREALAKFSQAGVRRAGEDKMQDIAQALHKGLISALLAPNLRGGGGADVPAAEPQSARCEDEMIYFDIGGEIRRQLADCGVPEENIFDFGGCTRCENEIFYSYRAGDEEKRNFLLAGCSTNRENM